MHMAMAEFLTKAFKDREVDVYCGGTDWFYGRVEDCVNGVVTLIAKEGAIHVNTERILSVSPRTA